MLNITNYQGNANQNHNEISPHTFQNGYYKKRQQTTSVAEDVEKREHLCTLDGNVNWYSLYGKHMEVPYKIKTELPYDLEVPLPGIYI